MQPRQIKQYDNYHFEIEWLNGKTDRFRLSDLQKRCSCAHCLDESTGKRRATARAVDADVKALNLKTVGKYALKITFTSGCSAGIYNYSDLYRQ